jgi:Zn-dependent protease
MRSLGRGGAPAGSLNSLIEAPERAHGGAVKNDIPLGHIRGIRVGLSWSVLLIAGFYVYVLATYQFPREAYFLSDTAYWIAGIVGALGFFLSLLVHEMSHALMAQRRGIGVRGITLWLLGGYAELDTEPTSPGHQFVIAAVGPVSNLALGGMFWLVHLWVADDPDVFAVGIGTSGLVAVVLGWLAFVNFLLGAFNLLPAAPLDGGQLFSAGVWAVTGNRTVARRWSAYAGVALGGAALVYGLAAMNSTESFNGIWLMIIGWWIISVALGDLRRTGAESALSTATAADIMRPAPPILPAHLSIDRALAVGLPSPTPPAFCAQAPDGRITGLLTADQIRSTDATSRATVPLGQLAFPIDRVALARTDEASLALIDRLRGNAVGQILVVGHDGRVAGTIGMAELDRAASRRRNGVPAGR